MDLPILAVSPSDIEDPVKMLRLLRALVDQNQILAKEVDDLRKEERESRLSFKQIRHELSANGRFPLNVTGLPGILGQPQPAGAKRYTATPTGLELQTLFDTQIIIVKNGALYDVYSVNAAAPTTLTQLVSATGPGNMMTTDTNQTPGATVVKTWTAQQVFNGGLTAAGIADFSNHQTWSLQAVSATPTTLTADTQTFVGVLTTTIGAASTVNLPAAGNNIGAIYVINDAQGGAAANNITVVGNAGNIDGAANYVINTAYGVLRVFWTGTFWKSW